MNHDKIIKNRTFTNLWRCRKEILIALAEVNKMNHNSVKTEKLVNLDVKAELKLLPMVLYAVREVSRKYGLEEKDGRDLTGNYSLS